MFLQPHVRGSLLGTITQLTRQLQGSILSGLFCVILIVLKCQEFHGDHRKGVSLVGGSVSRRGQDILVWYVLLAQYSVLGH